MRLCRLCQDGSRNQFWLRKTSGTPGSPKTLFSAANVELSFAEAWQLVQYCPKPMAGEGLGRCARRPGGGGGRAGWAGQSPCPPDPPQPYQPQNQPSCEPLESRT